MVAGELLGTYDPDIWLLKFNAMIVHITIIKIPKNPKNLAFCYVLFIDKALNK